MAISTFPASCNFLESLAEHLKTTRTPERMLETVVLLPSRRAVRNLKNEFRKLAAKQPIILPKIFAIADLEKDPVFFAELVGLSHIDTFTSIQAIKTIGRRFHLAQLCAGISLDQHHTLSFHKAFELADALGHLLDELQRQEIDLSNLENLSPDIYAVHWQEILKFLRIIIHYWPGILAEEKRIDPIEQRNILFQKLSALWQQKAPAFDLVIAGSTGSNLAVAKLMATIAKLPNGEVILPVFPLYIQDAEWEAVSYSHPYFFIKRFMHLAGAEPKDVVLLSPLKPNPNKELRSHIWATLMLPASLIHQWTQYKITPNALENLQYVTAQTREEEALQVAIICNHAITGNIRDICIVVEDIGVRKMLMGALQCMNLVADASENQTIGESAYASFANLLIIAARDSDNPLHILALWKHPYTYLHKNREMVLDCARYLEKNIFRTQVYAPTIPAMLEVLALKPDTLAESASALLMHYHKLIEPLAKLIRSPQTSLSKLYNQHLELIETFSTDRMGTIHCWNFDETGDAEIFIREISDYVSIGGNIDTSSYDKVLNMLLDAEQLHIARQTDYHITIMPSKEARLQPAELMVVMDMNEGVWPKAAGINPWMSRPMQEAIGLLMPETEASQKAHDLLMLMQADKVILSRSLIDDRAETRESRWLQRLNALLSAVDDMLPKQLKTEIYAHEKQELFKAVDIAKEVQPQPKPNSALRPTSFSITELELLKRDPYAIYAKHLLKLKPLEALDGLKEQTLFGDVAHAMLEAFIKIYPAQLPEPFSESEIDLLINSILHAKVHDANLAYLWRQKLSNIMHWVLEQESERRPSIMKIASEIDIVSEVKGVHATYLLKGRADRVEIYRDGSFKIIDYKTGKPPNQKDMREHIAGQLAVASWLILQNWPENLPQKATKAQQGEYWKLSAQLRNAAIVEHKSMVSENFLNESSAYIIHLLDTYKHSDTPFTAVPDRNLKPQYHTYDQLERYAEWA